MPQGHQSIQKLRNTLTPGEEFSMAETHTTSVAPTSLEPPVIDGLEYVDGFVAEGESDAAH